MPNQHQFLQHAGPGILGGVTFGDWLKILKANRFGVDLRYLPRASYITLLSILNSMLKQKEERCFGDQIQNTNPHPPIFILGVWRSGTTHLHNLLTRDTRFAYANLYQSLNPHTFLDGEEAGPDRLDRFVSPKRSMDNMLQGAREPVEEDIAMAIHGQSSMLGLVFPRSRHKYRRFVTMRDLPAEELSAWQTSYRQFLAKLTLAQGRPLVLKSPANTARIPVLLEMFPDARFITIHRHPEEVYQSALHALNATSSWWRLQAETFDGSWVRHSFAEVFTAYFQDRDLIPANNLCEVAYHDLVNDPLSELRKIYAALALPDFTEARDELGKYVDTLKSYSRNSFPELDEGSRNRLHKAWAGAYEQWGYNPVKKPCC